jgi:hypothetical protein
VQIVHKELRWTVFFVGLSLALLLVSVAFVLRLMCTLSSKRPTHFAVDSAEQSNAEDEQLADLEAIATALENDSKAQSDDNSTEKTHLTSKSRAMKARSPRTLV